MNYSLSEHMTYRKLLRVALPCIAMMISVSVYSVVDGFFVSNFAGKTQFAALNLIYPYIMVISSLGFMMGTGGSALVAKLFGEGKEDEGNRAFSNCVFFTIALGLIISLISFIFLPQIALWLGSDEEMLPHCVTYGRISIAGITFFNLQNLFQSFFTTAEKPRFGFVVTLLAGLANIAFDALFIVGFRLGVIGAAIGTVLGQAVGAIIPIVYFSRKNPSPLRLRFHAFQSQKIWKMASNGASEFVTNISAAVVSMLLNAALMKYYGQAGVGAYGIICYVWLIFAACFIGVNIATAPRISYAYGAKNTKELHSLFRKSLVILLFFGLFQFGFSEALAVPLSHLFAAYDAELLELTIVASRIYAIVYIFLGFNMFGSSFFTALNNGGVSMLLSFLRLGVLEVVAVLLLPNLMGGMGIWWSVPVAEGLGTIMNLSVMFAFGKRYGYIGKPEETANQENG